MEKPVPGFEAFASEHGIPVRIADPQSVFACRSCISIGVFDGVHRGHRKVISELVSESRKVDAVASVITFSKNPKDRLSEESRIELTGLEEKVSTILSLGVDYVLVLDFDDRLREMSGADFLSWLFANNVIKLVIGRDFKCGNASCPMDASGIAKSFPASTIIVDDVMQDDRRISSTLLRGIIRDKGFLSEDDRKKYLV